MHARSRFAFHTAFAALVLCLPARSAPAQQALSLRTPPPDVAAPARAAEPASDSASAAGPTADAARAGVSHQTSPELRMTTAPRRAGYGQPVALMVVGGAALLTGLIIGDSAGTVIAVGGALVGLYGLYEYLQ